MLTDKQLKKAPLNKIKKSLGIHNEIIDIPMFVMGKSNDMYNRRHLTMITTIVLDHLCVKQPRKKKKYLTRFLVLYYKLYRDNYLKPALKAKKTI